VNASLEIYHLQPGPDGITRIKARRFGEGIHRSRVVATSAAEDAILDEWAEEHDRLLGFPPAWSVANGARNA
jgi:hypothetical protein